MKTITHRKECTDDMMSRGDYYVAEVPLRGSDRKSSSIIIKCPKCSMENMYPSSVIRKWSVSAILGLLSTDPVGCRYCRYGFAVRMSIASDRFLPRI